MMGIPTRRSTSKKLSVRRGKVRKEFWLDPKALRRAQKILGAETERETVEIALDLVVFRQELTEGLETLAGLELDQRD
jgi:Arc/MetJ family transcription regulator